jgi:hypothetical protein
MAAAFVNRGTYGVARPVDNARDFNGCSSNFPESTSAWPEFLARTLLSNAVKQDIQRLVDEAVIPSL